MTSLDEFRCCLSNGTHFIIEPITLINCGHSACKECYPNDNQKFVKCKKCEVVSEVDISASQASTSFKKAIMFLYENMFQELEKETSSKLNDLKSLPQNQNDLLDLKIQYIEDEIDIRIESIKDQLELARDSLRNELSRIKTEVKISIEKTQLKDEHLSKYDLNLKELQNNIQNQMNLNEEWLDKYQKNLKDLNQSFKNEDQNISKVLEFNISKKLVSEKILGEIFYLYESDIYVKELLVNGKTKIIELNQDVFDILVLDNNRVVCSNYNQNWLLLYDQNFNLVRKVEKINGESFNPRGLACSDIHLYIADQLNHRILMTDFEFNKIKSVGSLGRGIDQFNGPTCICLKNEILCICDWSNKRIQVYNKDLEFMKSGSVHYFPWVIKASNLFIVVQPGSLKSLFIYELNSLKLMQKVDNPNEWCRLSVINSNIYRFNSKSRSVLVYDENGNLKEEIIINNVDTKLISDIWDGTFIAFNGDLLMTSYSAKKLIKFSRK